MIKFTNNFKVKGIDKLQLKIGIHRGDCMMGIIGYHKPQFSLIGDTINFAARHCATGADGHVMVSSEAWIHSELTNELKYTIVPTEMKGKGIADVYVIAMKTKDLRSTLLGAIERIDSVVKDNMAQNIVSD